jgi:hypothetical protein
MAKHGQTWPKTARNGQTRNMRMIRIHSRLPRYNLYTIPDTLQPVVSPLSTPLESKLDAYLWKSLSYHSKSGWNHLPICPKINQRMRLHNTHPLIDFGTDRQIISPWFWMIRQALFFPTLPFLALQQLLLAPNQLVDPKCLTWSWPHWADEHAWPVRKIPNPKLYDENSHFARSKKNLEIWLHLTMEYKVISSPNSLGAKLVPELFSESFLAADFRNISVFFHNPFYLLPILFWKLDNEISLHRK